MEGNVVHTWPLPKYGYTVEKQGFLLENGNLLRRIGTGFWAGGWDESWPGTDPSESETDTARMQELDWDGNIVYEIVDTRPGYRHHHDFVKIWNEQLQANTILSVATRNITHEEAIARAYRRAEKTTRRTFQEVTPNPITAAEAVTSIDQDYDKSPEKTRLAHSRACFIATAAYGSPDAPEVEQLRRFRDQRLLTNRFGVAFVRAYYSISPPIARLIARKPRLRVAIRKTLDFFRDKAAL